MMTELSSLLTRVRAEFSEMPGLRLTLAQACRLWQLEPTVCEVVLDALVCERFLLQTPSGAFVRAERR
jgi:hypothetical protein